MKVDYCYVKGLPNNYTTLLAILYQFRRRIRQKIEHCSYIYDRSCPDSSRYPLTLQAPDHVKNGVLLAFMIRNCQVSILLLLLSFVFVKGRSGLKLDTVAIYDQKMPSQYLILPDIPYLCKR